MSSEWKVVRTYSAGAWFGRISRREGKEVDMKDARRLWFWSGAASLSELAIRGVKYPDKCKFPAAVNVTLTEAIEIIDATPEAKAIIDGVKEWKA